jgi:hypothetical protein
MTRRKQSKKQFIKLITHYGIHIWAILIIANAAMVYAYQFATHAQNNATSKVNSFDISQAPAPSSLPTVSPNQTSPSSGYPLGPAINLQFTVPGIGSGGGVMKPIHLRRNVTIFLYSPDVNSINPTVKPLYTIQTFATFDSNPYSPTYTSYLNQLIDLGSDVKNGNYQIAFKTDQSLRTIIKTNFSDLGGKIFGLNQGSQVPDISPQTVLMGDILPSQGDNIIDINDYNAFVTCYGALNKTNSFCKTGNYGDFNDDGIIDGIDYNILVRSLYVIAQEGFSVPQLSPTPSSPNRVTKLVHPVTPTLPPQKKGPTPNPSSTKNSSGGGSLVGAILFVVFLIILGAIGFLLFKNEKFRTLVTSLIHLSPTGTPSSEPTQTEATEETPGDEAVQPDASTKTVSETSTTPEPPVEQEQPVAPIEPSKAGDILEKDCYIKTKGKDDAGTGMWLLLTDDFGAMNAHYAKADAKDGFAKVKGVMKEENGKKFLEISELTTEG